MVKSDDHMNKQMQTTSELNAFIKTTSALEMICLGDGIEIIDDDTDQKRPFYPQDGKRDMLSVCSIQPVEPKLYNWCQWQPFMKKWNNIGRNGEVFERTQRKQFSLKRDYGKIIRRP